MADAARRGVIFTLSVESDDSVSRVLGELSARVSETAVTIRQSLTEAIRGAMEDAGGGKVDMGQWLDASKAAVQQETEMRKDALAETTAVEQRELRKRVAEEAKATKEREKVQAQAAKEAERAAREQAKAAERAEKEEIARDLRIFKAKQKAIEDREKAEEQARAKREKAEAAAAAREVRAIEKQRKDIERFERQAEAAQERQRGHAMAMKSSLSEVGEGALRAGRGLAMLGVVNEKTTEDIVKGLVKIQAAYDVLKGGFEIWRKLTEAMHNYQKMVQAATVAEESLAAARKLSAASGVASGVAGGAGAAAAGAAGGVGGVGAAALGGGALLGGAAVAAITGTIAAGMMAFNVGGSRDWAANKMEKSGALDPDSKLGWAMTSNLPALFGYEKGTDLRNRALESMETSKRMETERTAMQDRMDVARLEVQGEERIRAAEQGTTRRQEADTRELTIREDQRSRSYMAAEAYRRTQEGLFRDRPGERATEEDRAKYGMRVRQAEFDYRQEQQQIDVGARRDTVQGAYDQAKRESDAESKRLEDLRAKSFEMSATGKVDGRMATGEDRARIEEQIAEAQKAAIDAQGRLLDVTKERLSAEEEISRVRIEAAEESIRMTKDEIALREALIEKETGKVRSAQEKLAGMNEEEFQQFQQQVQTIRGKQSRGEELTGEEFKFSQGLKDYREFEDITRKAAETTGERRRKQVGLGDAEQQAADRLKGEKQALEEKLEVQIKDERELRLTIQRDDSKLAREIGADIRKQLDERDRRMLEMIRQEVEKRTADLRNQQQTRANQARQSLGK